MWHFAVCCKLRYSPCFIILLLKLGRDGKQSSHCRHWLKSGYWKGIVQLLAKEQHGRPLTIYATSRSGTDTNIQVSPPNEIRYRKLDISDRSSIQSIFQLALKEHSSIDILINNAAVSNDYRETPEYAAQTVMNNYGGTRDMCKAFLSNLSREPGSRIVNVTSGYNQLSNYGLDLQVRFRAATTISDVDALAES